MSRNYEHHREREPEQTDRYWQAYAKRKAIEQAEWQYFDELKKNAAGAAAIEAEKDQINRAYADYNHRAVHENARHSAPFEL